MEGSNEGLQESTFKVKLAKPKDLSNILDQTTFAIEGKKKQRQKSKTKFNILLHLFRYARNIGQSGKIANRDTWMVGQRRNREQRTNGRA